MTRPRRPHLCRAMLPAAAALGAITAAGPARAGERANALGAAAALAVLTDAVFTAVDIRLVTESTVPATTLAAWEGGLGTAGLAAFSALEIHDVVTRAPGTENAVDVLQITAAAWAGGLAVHGWWTGLAPHVSPVFAAGASGVIGADLALTAASATRLFEGRFWGTPAAVTETVLALAGIAGSAVALRLDEPADRSVWIGLTAWSAVLAAHGVASLVVGPVLPPPTPRAAPAVQGLRVVPVVLRSERSTGHGIGVAGVF